MAPKPLDIDSEAFLRAQNERILTLNVYLVSLQLRKSMKVSAGLIVERVLTKIAKHLPSGTDASLYGLFLPSSDIWFSPSRPLFSYVLTENTVRPMSTLSLSLSLINGSLGRSLDHSMNCRQTD